MGCERSYPTSGHWQLHTSEAYCQGAPTPALGHRQQAQQSKTRCRGEHCVQAEVGTAWEQGVLGWLRAQLQEAAAGVQPDHE